MLVWGGPYFQRELRKTREDYQTKLTEQVQELKAKYNTKQQQLELENGKTAKQLSEQTFLLSRREAALTDLKANLAKLTQ